MKTKLIVAVVVLVVLATGAWAQGTGMYSPRAAGMGGAAIGVADDAAAWFQNPAGLAALSVPAKEGVDYGNDALFAFADNDNQSAWELSWSGWKPADSMGFGAGFGDAEGLGSAFGAGFGIGLKETPLSAGVNIMAVNPDFGSAMTVVNAGGMYRLGMGEGKAPLRVGLSIIDITDEMGGPYWNVGIGWKATSDLLIAVDAVDLSDETGLGVQVGGGVELALGAQKSWRLRAGVSDDGVDTNYSAGLGYQAKQWRADFAYVDTDPDATWSIGIGVNL